jgi:hypothetical protein
MKWEYKVEFRSELSCGLLSHWLNDFGEDGWELTSVRDAPDAYGESRDLSMCIRSWLWVKIKN